MGHDTLIDGMIKDGLWDVYNDFGMDICAELCADLHAITREEQVLLPDIINFFSLGHLIDSVALNYCQLPFCFVCWYDGI